jgi:glutamate formiminotransferase / 5-formyltetrahydrofolate cyclo-ligase
VAQFSLVGMTPPLLAVPNISEGRDRQLIAAIGRAFAGQGATAGIPDGAEDARRPASTLRLLDVHSDPDHHRSVFTLAGAPGELAEGLLGGVRAAVGRIDVKSEARQDRSSAGQHPHVGAVDVVPVVYLEERSRGAACAEALVVAERIGSELHVPVFLYGELTESESSSPRTRAQLRRGGVAGLTARISGSIGEDRLRPDFGPAHMHPRAGATLVAARKPLVAFNLQLARPAGLADARCIASLIREGGREGLPGVRAIAVALGGEVAQVSMNVERPLEVSLATVVEAVAKHAEVASAELVGLAPRAALAGFPSAIPLLGFDPARHVIENALGC